MDLGTIIDKCVIEDWIVLNGHFMSATWWHQFNSSAIVAQYIAISSLKFPKAAETKSNGCRMMKNQTDKIIMKDRIATLLSAPGCLIPGNDPKRTTKAPQVGRVIREAYHFIQVGMPDRIDTLDTVKYSVYREFPAKPSYDERRKIWCEAAKRTPEGKTITDRIIKEVRGLATRSKRKISSESEDDYSDSDATPVSQPNSSPVHPSSSSDGEPATQVFPTPPHLTATCSEPLQSELEELLRSIRAQQDSLAAQQDSLAESVSQVNHKLEQLSNHFNIFEKGAMTSVIKRLDVMADLYTSSGSYSSNTPKRARPIRTLSGFNSPMAVGPINPATTLLSPDPTTNSDYEETPEGFETYDSHSGVTYRYPMKTPIVNK